MTRGFAPRTGGIAGVSAPVNCPVLARTLGVSAPESRFRRACYRGFGPWRPSFRPSAAAYGGRLLILPCARGSWRPAPPYRGFAPRRRGSARKLPMVQRVVPVALSAGVPCRQGAVPSRVSCRAGASCRAVPSRRIGARPLPAPSCLDDQGLMPSSLPSWRRPAHPVPYRGFAPFAAAVARGLRGAAGFFGASAPALVVLRPVLRGLRAGFVAA